MKTILTEQLGGYQSPLGVLQKVKGTPLLKLRLLKGEGVDWWQSKGWLREV